MTQRKNGALALTLALILLAGTLAGCGEGRAAEPEKLQIIATIFPEYDWVKQLLGDRTEGAELTLLLDKGVDMHSYQPSADDIIRISTCDMFVYVGGESDGWVRDALAGALNQDMVVIDLMEVLGRDVKEEELVEGMQAEACETEPEYDEHVWLSLKNAAVLCEAIAEGLADLDPDNAQAYAANAETYRAKLDGLDREYQSAVDGAAVKTLIFGDRFPFRYLADDYGLDYYAAFPGCSAETEASFETVLFLAGKLDQLGLKTVLTMEAPRHRIAETIVENTEAKDARILVMDSMQSATAEDAAGGTSYLSVMESNLGVLKAALKGDG